MRVNILCSYVIIGLAPWCIFWVIFVLYHIVQLVASYLDDMKTNKILDKYKNICYNILKYIKG